MESKIRTVLAAVKKSKGFTLIELLIVIAIIAILTVAFLPGALKAPAKARDAQRVKSLNDIAAALESYAAEHSGSLPASIADFCLPVPPTGDLAVLASVFPNSTFPTDPKPVGNGACNLPPKVTAYFYNKIGTTNYVIAGVMEVQISANSSLVAGAAPLTSTDITAIKGATLTNGGGTQTSGITPNAATPMYVIIGPR